jgi:murein DD-endopeptidase MepM/ murein hydrolase activator NlpD
MADPQIRGNKSKALRIGQRLMAGAKSFGKGIRNSVDTSKQVITQSARKINRDQKIINKENKKQERFEDNIRETTERAQRGISKGAYAVGGVAKKFTEKVLVDPMKALWNIVAAWAIRNLPKLIEEARKFVKKVRIVVAAINRGVAAIGNVFKGMLSYGKAWLTNMVTFDWKDSKGRLKSAEKEIEDGQNQLGESWDTIYNVWGKEEEELDKLLEYLGSDKTAQEAADATVSGLALPQTPAFGEGSRESAPAAVGGGGGGSTRSGKVGALLDTIAFAEGTSDANGYNKWFGGRTDMDLSKMTINQVVVEQKRRLNSGEATYNGYKSAAVGRYQMMEPEMAAVTAGLDPAVAKFTPENQDKMVMAQYIKGQAGISDAQIEGGITPQMIDQLAPVFASFPNLFGADSKGRVGTNTSYYGQGGKTQGAITANYGENLQRNTGTPQPQAGAASAMSSPASSGSISPSGTTTNTSSLRIGDVVGGFEVSSAMGRRAAPTAGASSNHGGVDIATPQGTYLAFDVDVEIMAAGGYGGYGYLIDAWSESLGMQFRCAHMSEIMCKPGQRVRAGTPVGRTGGAKGTRGAGTSTGPHLHFEVDNQRNSTRPGGSRNNSMLAKAAKHLILSRTKPKPGSQSQNQSLRPASFVSSVKDKAGELWSELSSKRTNGRQTNNNTVLLNQKTYVK